MLELEKRSYLAYGSNLNVRRMLYRCPNTKIIGTAVLTDYQLLFKGSKVGAYLTIEPKAGAFVPVGVWEVSEIDEQYLDVYEGYPHFYYKKNYSCRLLKSKQARFNCEMFSCTSCTRITIWELPVRIICRSAVKAMTTLALIRSS